MIVLASPYTFVCNRCQITIGADRPDDFKFDPNADPVQFYVECPICNTKHFVNLDEVPKHIRRYIRRPWYMRWSHRD